MEVAQSLPLLPGDPRLIDYIVCELKNQGIFDQFRKECIADVDTKPAYQNLRQRVEVTVDGFLARQNWKPDLNKNQLREKLRKHILDSNFLEQGVERIVDQVVNPKIASVFLPQVEEVVYKCLGLEKPEKPCKPDTDFFDNASKPLHVDTDTLLPNDLEAVSPDSVKSHDKSTENPLINSESEDVDMKLVEDKQEPKRTVEGGAPSVETSYDSDDSKDDDFESPAFEPIDDLKTGSPNVSQHSVNSDNNSRDSNDWRVSNVDTKPGKSTHSQESSDSVDEKPFKKSTIVYDSGEDANMTSPEKMNIGSSSFKPTNEDNSSDARQCFEPLIKKEQGEKMDCGDVGEDALLKSGLMVKSCTDSEMIESVKLQRSSVESKSSCESNKPTLTMDVSMDSNDSKGSVFTLSHRETYISKDVYTFANKIPAISDKSLDDTSNSNDLKKDIPDSGESEENVKNISRLSISASEEVKPSNDDDITKLGNSAKDKDYDDQRSDRRKSDSHHSKSRRDERDSKHHSRSSHSKHSSSKSDDRKHSSHDRKDSSHRSHSSKDYSDKDSKRDKYKSEDRKDKHHSSSHRSSSSSHRHSSHKSSSSSKHRHSTSERSSDKYSKSPNRTDSKTDRSKDTRRSSRESSRDKSSTQTGERDRSSHDKYKHPRSGHRDKHSSSSSDRYKKEKRQDDRKNKDKEEQCSTFKSNRSRRSTDRDSNDGNDNFTKQSSSTTNTSTHHSSSREKSSHKSKGGGGQSNGNSSSGQSDSVEVVDKVKVTYGGYIKSEFNMFQPVVKKTPTGPQLHRPPETAVTSPPLTPSTPTSTDTNISTPVIKKPVIHIDGQLNPSNEEVALELSQTTQSCEKMKKPKIASNIYEARKLMKVRKNMDILEQRNNQNVRKELEQSKSISKNESKVYSGSSGPELQIICRKRSISNPTPTKLSSDEWEKENLCYFDEESRLKAQSVFDNSKKYLRKLLMTHNGVRPRSESLVFLLNADKSVETAFIRQSSKHCVVKPVNMVKTFVNRNILGGPGTALPSGSQCYVELNDLRYDDAYSDVLKAKCLPLKKRKMSEPQIIKPAAEPQHTLVTEERPNVSHSLTKADDDDFDDYEYLDYYTKVDLSQTSKQDIMEIILGGGVSFESTLVDLNRLKNNDESNGKKLQNQKRRISFKTEDEVIEPRVNYNNNKSEAGQYATAKRRNLSSDDKYGDGLKTLDTNNGKNGQSMKSLHKNNRWGVNKNMSLTKELRPLKGIIRNKIQETPQSPDSDKSVENHLNSDEDVCSPRSNHSRGYKENSEGIGSTALNQINHQIKSRNRGTFKQKVPNKCASENGLVANKIPTGKT